MIRELGIDVHEKIETILQLKNKNGHIEGIPSNWSLIDTEIAIQDWSLKLRGRIDALFRYPDAEGNIQLAIVDWKLGHKKIKWQTDITPDKLGHPIQMQLNLYNFIFRANKPFNQYPVKLFIGWVPMMYRSSPKVIIETVPIYPVASMLKLYSCILYSIPRPMSSLDLPPQRKWKGKGKWRGRGRGKGWKK